MHWRAGLLLLAMLCGTGEASQQGEYLFHIAGCRACHSVDDGPVLAGGRAFVTDYGTFYSPNITPDKATGIGDWTREQFIRAMKHGESPNGDAYYPAFPYTSYRRMRDEDAGAIFDYLMTREPHEQVNRNHQLPWWLGRWMMKPWQWWLLDDPDQAPKQGNLRRGHYLVEAIGHCGECHTPRELSGIIDRSRHLAGTRNGPEGDKVPNITPHREDGIGKWDSDDLDYFLESGELPNGDYAGSVMAEVIDHATSKLSDDDRRAMVDYLMSLPALSGP